MKIERHHGVREYKHIKVGSISYEKVKTFKYLEFLFTNQNPIHEEIECRLKAGNSCYYSDQTLFSSRHLCKNLKYKIYKTITLHTMSYIKGGMKAKCFQRQDPKEWRVENALQ